MKPTESPLWARFTPKGVADTDANLLYEAALQVPDGGLILEIGSFKGSSTYALVLGAQGRNVKVHAVDTWMGSPGGLKEWPYGPAYTIDEFKHNLKEMLENGTVIMHEMSSAGAYMIEPPLKPNLIFIDGSHQYEDVLFDVTFWWERLQPNGVVALHDCLDHPNAPTGPKRAVDLFISRHEVASCEVKGWITWLRKP